MGNNLAEDDSLFNKIPKELHPIVEETARSSQSNFDDLFRGKVRSLFIVLHPMERGWLFRRRNSPHPLRRAILNKVLKKKHLPVLASSLSGINMNKIKQYFKELESNDKLDYYESETFPEYQFIRHNTATTGQQDATYKLVTDYNDWLDVIDNKPGTIAVILTIEGGHALAQYPKQLIFHKEYHQLDQKDEVFIRKGYLKNVKRIKGLLKTKSFHRTHTPFFITLAHMYNNFLCGHAKSYKEGIGIFPGMDDFLDQEAAMNTGITPLGHEVIAKLLNKSSTERRVLIDVKHMSLQARKEYYRIVEGLNAKGDQIPIIFSHGGVNGMPESMFRGIDVNADDRNAYLSHWSINLFNEDIIKIYESDGLIGLAPHEGRMPGGETLVNFKAIKQAIKWKDHRKKEYEMMLRLEYVKLFLTNVFHIVSIINHREAWDIICIGSDFDGIMNPFDSYKKSSQLMRFLGDMKEFLDKSGQDLVGYFGPTRITIDRQERKELMFGLSSAKIIRKLRSENTKIFLSKYFTPEYLGGSNQTA